jgi:hypothetical protein
MDWGDRDWAQNDEWEPRISDDAAAHPPAAPRTARAVILLGAVTLAAIACVVAGQVPRHHPLVPAFSFTLPHIGGRTSHAVDTSVAGGRTEPLGGSNVATDPSTYTLRGRTASTDGLHVPGPVVLRGRWNQGPWLELVRSRTDAAGNFRVTIKLHRRGLLDLRLQLPDGFVGTKTLRVS